MPHFKTRLMHSASGLFRGYANSPHTIYLGISNKCNLQCKMCDLGQDVNSLYRHNLAPNKELTVTDWKDFIDKIAVYRPAIELSAAEPFLYKDFVSLVRYIKQVKNLECRIFTNGYLLEENSEFLREVNIDHIIVSIDGPPKVHDSIRGKPGLFAKVMCGLLAVKKNSDIKPPLVDINYTISHYNFGRIEEAFNAIVKHGVLFNRFTIIQTLGITKEAARKHNQLYPDFPASPICETAVEFNSIDIGVLNEQISTLMNRHNQKVRIYPDVKLDKLSDWYNKPDEFVGNAGCRFIWNSANITSDGEVIPYIRCVCKSFGNITKDGFRNIWNSKNFREFRILSKKIGLFPICARCSASFTK